MTDLIDRQAAIDTLNVGAELLRRVLDDAYVVGAERAKYEWGLGLIEAYISDMKELPSAQPNLSDGLKIIEQFLQSCEDSLTCEIVAPNGMKLHTDWGYFVEGLEELRRYAERKHNELV